MTIIEYFAREIAHLTNAQEMERLFDLASIVCCLFLDMKGGEVDAGDQLHDWLFANEIDATSAKGQDAWRRWIQSMTSGLC